MLARLWPAELPCRSEPNDEQTGPLLRHSVLERREHRRVDAIAGCSKTFEQARENDTIVPPREVWNILNEHGARFQFCDHLEEGSPKPRSRILCFPDPRGNQLSQPGLSSPGEWLTGHTTRNEVHAR